MITQTWRLKKWRIAHLFSKGKRISNNFFDTKYLVTKAENSHFCVIVSKKIAPLAVDRNRLRRQIYEILRLESSILKSPSDMIIIAKTQAKGKDYEQLKKNLLLLLDKIGQ